MALSTTKSSLDLSERSNPEIWYTLLQALLKLAQEEPIHLLLTLTSCKLDKDLLEAEPQAPTSKLEYKLSEDLTTRKRREAEEPSANSKTTSEASTEELISEDT